MIRALALALLLLGACDGTCSTTTQEGPGLSGTFRYTTAEGITSEGSLAGFFVEMTDRTAFSITGSFTDDLDNDRSVAIHAGDFDPGVGVIDIAGLGELCMSRATGDEPVCSELAGTIDVRRLAADCYHHESGIGTCAETIDFTLSATSTWEGTAFAIDALELTVGEWVDTPCDD